MEKAEVDSMEDTVSQDSTAYDFNIRIICFLGLSLGTFVIALMCLCKSYEWCCKSPGLNNLRRHQQQDDNDDHDDTQEIEAETSPLINNSIASQESSTNYHTALQDGFSFSSSSSSSSQPESIVIVE